MLNSHFDRQEAFREVLHGKICIQDLIENQVLLTPNAVALIWNGENLTYHELNCRANQLAHYLRKLGVGPETVIGICMVRSFDLVIGILGILKAGGAYLPLDPSYPPERLSLILEDSNAGLVLTHDEAAGVLLKSESQVISLDQNWCELSSFSADNPVKITTADNLAYVIYTSGTTGKPKGVMITHSNLCQFVRIASTALDVLQEDKYLQTASIAYALSVRQLMVPLSFGSAIVLATLEETRDPLALFELIKVQNVTLMDMVPSFWRTCIQRLSDLPDDERRFLLDNRLRRIVTVGEPLYSDIPHGWMNKIMHPAKLVNIFGQTETTGIVAAYPIPNGMPISAGIVPIGKSILDTRLYILDSDLRPVIDGEVGELCVSNPCLARGYIGQPDLTAQKFIPNPFADGFSDRLYRTGDLACYGKDGNIQFLGRGDQQVKIRGQRLELSEVEIVLRQHPGIQECVVSAQGGISDDKYLAAYIVLSKSHNLGSRELRAFLKRRLPDYMVPTIFVFLDKLPTTPNGKIDRLSLPDPRDIAVAKDGITPVGPRNDIERRVATIWHDLLKFETISIHDDFFDLGGHSFLAVQLFSCIEQNFGIRLPLTTLFHATTIAQISTLIEDWRRTEKKWSPVVPVRTTGDKPPFFGVHGLEGGVLFWRDMLDYLPDDQPFYAIQAQGVDGTMPALTSIEEMGHLYIDEIRKIQPHGPYHLGGYSMGGVIAYEMGQQLLRIGEKVDSLVMFDTQNPKRIKELATEEEDVKWIARSISGRLKEIKRRIIEHSYRLARLGVKEQAAYLFRDIRYRILRRLVFVQADMMRLFHRRLSDALLLSYLKFAHSLAVYKYVPASYPGKISLFRANQSLDENADDSALSWWTLTKGNIDIFHFNATHNITNAEYAKDIAQRLIECLSKPLSE